MYCVIRLEEMNYPINFDVDDETVLEYAESMIRDEVSDIKPKKRKNKKEQERILFEKKRIIYKIEYNQSTFKRLETLQYQKNSNDKLEKSKENS